ncbi:hypothetical protein BJ973_000074 [Actinoplanes tereljensis]|uniref:Uncharacterized protein n=1 Tax=Paractinoplanes tereljensis TaxID=571912 RepID=A0A919NZU0_9ACTN|nr:hypothetical protein [Actinoplanes tereljensis]GIF26834.1 hypothetical protein Ate02nite_95640 [Actinoplanes tereljensis]
MRREIPFPVPAGTSPSCLRCARPDRLSRVEAVVRQQRTTTVVHGQVTGPYGYAVPVRAHAVHTSRLASALAPPRGPRPPASLALLAIVTTLGAARSLDTVVASAGAHGKTGAMVMVALAAAGWLLVRARSADLSRSRTVADRALWLWKRCWYCHRCGGVSLFTPNGSATLAADALALTLLDLASHLVWPPGSVPARTAEQASPAAGQAAK